MATIMMLHCSVNSLCAISISDDASLLAGSFDDSLVRLWSLTSKKLQGMKPSTQLSVIPTSAGVSSHYNIIILI